MNDTEKYELAKQMYLDGKSLSQIHREIGFERHRLAYLLREDGIEIVKDGKKHDYDETIFQSIETEEQAYWLGFLYADGAVAKYKNEVKLSLAYKDMDHVIKFANFALKTGNGKEIVHEYKAKLKGQEFPSAKVQITNKKIIDDLKRLGCVPNKSLILTFPNENQVPDYLIRHFIRGYFDGDGSIFTPTAYPNARTISFVGTQSFLSSLIKIFQNICTDFGTVNLYQKQNQQAWQFSKTKRDTNKEIYEYLYKDATIYLERKYERFASLYGKL